MALGAGWMLWLLGVLLVAGAGWWWLWRARRLHRNAVGAAVEGTRPGLRWSRALLGAAILLIALAAARPLWNSGEQTLGQSESALVVALDVSLSMAAEDVDDGARGTISRFRAAQSEIRRLVDARRGDPVGLVIFAGDAFLRFPLTRDHSAALAVLEALQPGEALVAAGSDIAAGIDIATESIVRRMEDDLGGGWTGAIVVVGDGETHSGDAVAAASEAQSSGLQVFTVGVGSDQGAGIPLPDSSELMTDSRSGRLVQTRLNADALRSIAAAGGGRYIELDAPGSMAPINADLAALDLIRPVRVVETENAEQFQWLVLAAIVALLGSIAARAGNWRRWLPLAAVSAVLAASGCGGPSIEGVNREAIALYESGDYARSLDRWREAQRLARNSETGGIPALNLNVARALHQLGQYQRAETEALSALRAEDPATRAAAWSLAGQHRWANDDLLGAQAAFIEALREQPDLMSAKWNLEIVNRLLEELEASDQPTGTGEQSNETGLADQSSAAEPNGDGEGEPGSAPGDSDSEGAGTPGPSAPTLGDAIPSVESRLAAEAELEAALDELPLEFASLEQALAVLDALRAVPGEGLAAGRRADGSAPNDW